MSFLVLEHVPYEGTTVTEVETFDDACRSIRQDMVHYKTHVSHFEIVEVLRHIEDVKETMETWMKENPDG